MFLVVIYVAKLMVLGLEKKMEKEYYGKPVKEEKKPVKQQTKRVYQRKTYTKRHASTHVSTGNRRLNFLSDYGEIYYMRRKR
jgi:hypothetical protein